MEWGPPGLPQGAIVPDFPNFFMTYGPNTIVVNGSIVFFSEYEIRYILGCLALSMEQGQSLAVAYVVHDSFNEAVDQANEQMAWGRTQVNNWYKNAKRQVTQGGLGHFLSTGTGPRRRRPVRILRPEGLREAGLGPFPRLKKRWPPRERAGIFSNEGLSPGLVRPVVLHHALQAPSRAVNVPFRVHRYAFRKGGAGLVRVRFDIRDKRIHVAIDDRCRCACPGGSLGCSPRSDSTRVHGVENVVLDKEGHCSG